MKTYAGALIFLCTLVASGQVPYKPTEEEQRQEELGRKMRARQIAPADFFKQVFDTEIVFYGQVVDWHGVPVEGASITYTPVADFSTSGGGRDYNITSGKDGNFTIKARGIRLYVSVEKEGFRPVQIPPEFKLSDAPAGRVGSLKSFSYFNGEGYPELNHHPVEGQPVQFVIRKIGSLETLNYTNESMELSSDGRPKIVSLHGRNLNMHRIKLVFLSECKGTVQNEDYRHFNWSFELRVEGGGIIEQLDDGYEAPVSGYMPSVVVASMRADGPGWRSDFNEKKYYVRFDDGVCARIRLRGTATYVNGENKPHVYLKGVLNPNPRSRNLETEPGR